MQQENPGIRWGVEQRLEFIEFRLFWEGRVNRSDIIHMFGVSVPQASKDLALYQELAPGNVEYDKSAKRYVAAGTFDPRFLKPDPNAYLSRLRSLAERLTKPSDSWIGDAPDSDIALTPERDIDTELLRAVLNAVRDTKSIEIFYQSMSNSNPDPIWRRITPHSFGYDGFRWHVRAYCHNAQKFKDFLLPRILGCRAPDHPGAPGAQDRHWHEHFSFDIVPHPKLTSSQQMVVAKDYGMKDGKCTLSVRYAMLFYVLKRLGLLNDATLEDPKRQHIVVLDRVAVQSALEKAEFFQDITEKESALRRTSNDKA